jgi:hypothetical protein
MALARSQWYSGVFAAFLNMSSRSGMIDMWLVTGFLLNLNREETLTLARVVSLYPTDVRMVNQLGVIAHALRRRVLAEAITRTFA